MQIIGYHTLQDRGNPREIEQEGSKYCYQNNAWLGHGYYFWDTEISWAHRWKKGDPKGYMICEAKILIDERTFDLFGNVAHQKEYLTCVNIMKSLSINNVSVPNVIQYLKSKTDFEYNSIRAFDDPKPIQFSYDDKSNEQISFNKRVQVCLIDRTNLLLDSFRVIFPERYLK